MYHIFFNDYNELFSDICRSLLNALELKLHLTLKFTKRQNFRLVQTETIYRQQSKCNLKKRNS